MTNRLSRLRIAAALSGVTLGTCVAAGAGPATGPTTKPATSHAAVPADYTAVRRGTLRLSFDADGVLEAVDPFEVKFAPKKYAAELTVRRAAADGATVAKGDVLLAVDTDPIDRQIAAAESAASVARAALAKAESDVTLGEKADALAMGDARQSAGDAEEGLKRWDATDGPASVEAGSLQARQYADALADATDELGQLRQMYKSEDLTNQTADIVLKRAVRQVEIDKKFERVATATADKATTYDPLVHRHGLVSATRQAAQTVEQLQAAQAEGRVVRAAALTAAQAAAADADRTLADLKRDRATLTVTSPVDGVLVYGAFDHKAWQPTDPKRLAVDEKVQPEQVLMTVYQPGHLKVSADCDEGSVGQMPPGQRVTVRSDVVRGVAYDGTCGPAALPASGKRDATLDVPVTLATPVDPKLLPGYYVSVGVDVPPLTDVMLVPATAVWHGKVSVRGADGKDQVRSVNVGQDNATDVQVRSGLSDGDAVLTKFKG